jgi:hypothetical protein
MRNGSSEVLYSQACGNRNCLTAMIASLPGIVFVNTKNWKPAAQNCFLTRSINADGEASPPRRKQT